MNRVARAKADLARSLNKDYPWLSTDLAKELCRRLTASQVALLMHDLRAARVRAGRIYCARLSHLPDAEIVRQIRWNATHPPLAEGGGSSNGASGG